GLYQMGMPGCVIMPNPNFQTWGCSIPPRGGGIEIRLYDTDPEDAVARAEAHGGTILQEPTNKPHGLREAYILCENGYAWVPSQAKTA
uniref:VOC family protein n=1 Tax=Tateyamaria pelophila TaxID=328415 RepID=UPI0037D9A10E